MVETLALSSVHRPHALTPNPTRSTVAGGRWTPASYPRLPQLAQPPQRQLAQLSAARLRLTACPPPKPRRPPRVSRHRLGAAPPLQLASRGWARVRREEKARDGKEAAEGGGLDADAEGAAVEGLRREQLERVAKRGRGARDRRRVADVVDEQHAHQHSDGFGVEDEHRPEVAHSRQRGRDGASILVVARNHGRSAAGGRDVRRDREAVARAREHRAPVVDRLAPGQWAPSVQKSGVPQSPTISLNLPRPRA
mmetsp:Transcript_36210/g.116956  ORF Transcript_36210/g.116956 Transcript_36210/m.116956 type:complete len:252 (-) Transcript_36210:68-823(-)